MMHHANVNTLCTTPTTGFPILVYKESFKNTNCATSNAHTWLYIKSVTLPPGSTSEMVRCAETL